VSPTYGTSTDEQIKKTVACLPQSN